MNKIRQELQRPIIRNFKVTYFDGSRMAFKFFDSLYEAYKMYKNFPPIKTDIYLDNLNLDKTILSR